MTEPTMNDIMNKLKVLKEVSNKMFNTNNEVEVLEITPQVVDEKLQSYETLINKFFNSDDSYDNITSEFLLDFNELFLEFCYDGFRHDSEFYEDNVESLKDQCREYFKNHVMSPIFTHKPNTFTLGWYYELIKLTFILSKFLPEKEYKSFIKSLCYEFENVFMNTLIFKAEHEYNANYDRVYFFDVFKLFIKYCGNKDEISMLLDEPNFLYVWNKVEDLFFNAGTVCNMLINTYYIIATEFPYDYKEEYSDEEPKFLYYVQWAPEIFDEFLKYPDKKQFIIKCKK